MSPKSLSALALITATITMAALVWAERSRPSPVGVSGAPTVSILREPYVDGELADLRLRIASLNVSVSEFADELILMRRERTDVAQNQDPDPD